MQATTQGARATSSNTAQSVQQPALTAEAVELDYTPKKMTPRETLILTLKLALAAGAFFGLLWLAHVKLEN